MTNPTIHINGTRPEVLRDAYTAARQAVNAAFNAVATAGPNARDYYVVSGTLSSAIKEHVARLNALTKIAEELSDLEVYCDSYSSCGKTLGYGKRNS